MNKILIAEDEKFIRMGLKTMVQRSPVPVGEILEARDGEEALELLRQHTVDLLITDIRMPKMDGIQLVHQLGIMGRSPMILVVSGYDDFSYAVEMLRNGASDYLLKPVERERLYEALEKLEEQFRQRQAAGEEQVRQEREALRRLMLEGDGTAGRLSGRSLGRSHNDGPGTAGRLSGRSLGRSHNDGPGGDLAARYGGSFFPGEYVGFCAGALGAPLPEDVLCLRGEGPELFYAVPAAGAEGLAELLPLPAGRSGTCSGLEQLPQCYRQAREAWRRSFFSGAPEAAPIRAPERPVAANARQLAGLVGLARGQETIRLLRGEAQYAAQGETAPEEFARLCAEFAAQVKVTCQSLVELAGGAERFADIWAFPDCRAYLDELEQWLDEFCGKAAEEFSDYENKQKIRQGVQYIQQHFREPLNMAVVSNHVSMNYSLFSLLFKQYTGGNFVSYLQKLRIDEAKRLLEATDRRVNEIGRHVGFSDEKHFLKVFKSAVGLSPTEYRRSAALMKPETKSEP